jgi:small subunit ribosomal protein S2
MNSIDMMLSDGTFETLSKREKLQISRQRAKLEKNLGSIADLAQPPAALFIVDIQKEANAVKEAKRLNIPIIAVVDTCCDPTNIDFVIPANDDAAKSIDLIVGIACDAMQEGINERKSERDKRDKKEKNEQPRTEEAAYPEHKVMRARKQKKDYSRDNRDNRDSRDYRNNRT